MAMATKNKRVIGAMPPERYDGIVLNLKKGMAAQSMLTVFTKQRGWMRIFLTKGKKAMQGVGGLLPFSLISFDAWQKGNTFSLGEYECQGNDMIRNFSYERYVYMQIFVEMVLVLFPEGEADGAVFSLLEHYSQALPVKDTRILTIIAGWQLVSAAGFRPDTAQVQVYLDGLDESGQQQYSFADEPPELGSPVRLPDTVRNLWEKLLDYSWQDAQTIIIGKQSITTLEALLYSYVRQCAEWPLKSIAALGDIG